MSMKFPNIGWNIFRSNTTSPPLPYNLPVSSLPLIDNDKSLTKSLHRKIEYRVSCSIHTTAYELVLHPPKN